MPRPDPVRGLTAILGEQHVEAAPSRSLLIDESGVPPESVSAAALVRPGDAAEVAAVVAWCYEHDVPVTPRGGGTGLAGGAIPFEGGVVVALERLNSVGDADPYRWSVEVGAGVRTDDVRRIARENGLFFPPDPGAGEQSQIGGNIATNAAGPHALKYGAVRNWVRALDVVVPPGRVVRLGADVSKDSSALDLGRLFVGSEGALGLIVGAVLRLVPAPVSALGGLVFFDSVEAGAGAICELLGVGARPAALEFLDATPIRATAPFCPAEVPPQAEFVLMVEFDGSPAEAASEWDEAVEVFGPRALAIEPLASRAELAAGWDWRHGVPGAVKALHGGFTSNDIVVPVDCLGEVVRRTAELGERHRLPSCSYGHGGDGNVHSLFMVDGESADDLRRAGQAGEELLDLAIELGGTVSGEHGVGAQKLKALARQCGPEAIALQAAVKRAVDPKGLMNPGTKLPSAQAAPKVRLGS